MFHCAPNVPHYAKNKAVGVMKAGHCFTIEPMINVGVWGDQTWPDNWTSVTQVRQTELPRVYTFNKIVIFPNWGQILNRLRMKIFIKLSKTWSAIYGH